ncbi:MAG: hypothetical protein QGI80_02790 [archaeon]|jgi:hypothetical protein|nr:hypothetical protein [archaeon]
MRETRLTIARREYAKGNLEHIYVQEFLDILKDPPKMKVMKNKTKKKESNNGK